MSPDPRENADVTDPMLLVPFGEFRAVRLIATGGMGSVYEGIQPVIGKRVAIKILNAGALVNPVDAESLLFEARLVNKIRHRGIVDIFSFGQLEDGRHFIVMELLDGVPLDRWIAERAPLSPREALPILDGVLDALCAAHQVGVIHRDLKPSNIVVVIPATGERYVKLLDFGLAKKIERPLVGVGGQSTVVGTPCYMAPEQALGLGVGPQTDLYSLGCVAFEMLTARRPYSAPTSAEMIREQSASQTPRVSDLRPDIAPAVDDLVAELMQYDPAARPHSAVALRRRVSQIGEEVATRERTERHALAAENPTGRIVGASPSEDASNEPTGRLVFSKDPPAPDVESPPTLLPSAEPRRRASLTLTAVLGIVGAAAGAVVISAVLSHLARGPDEEIVLHGSPATEPIAPTPAPEEAPPPPAPAVDPAPAAPIATPNDSVARRAAPMPSRPPPEAAPGAPGRTAPPLPPAATDHDEKVARPPPPEAAPPTTKPPDSPPAATKPEGTQPDGPPEPQKAPKTVSGSEESPSPPELSSQELLDRIDQWTAAMQKAEATGWVDRTDADKSLGEIRTRVRAAEAADALRAASAALDEWEKKYGGGWLEGR